jgi:hypothetical protein
MIASNNNPGQKPVEKSQNEIPGHGNMPNEDPGKRTSRREILYPHESEANPQREGADTSFTERKEVTPPQRQEIGQDPDTESK